MNVWASFLVGFGAAILNTPHCLGMCGGFSLHLVKLSKNNNARFRLGLFVAGKSFTYIFAGSISASLGIILFRNTYLAAYAPIFRISAAFITLMFGLLMLGLKLPPIKGLQNIAESRLVRGVFGSLFITPNPLAAFILGLGAGLLPCPLPLGMMAMAAASHSIIKGMALMAGVGLGTAPGLLALGMFGIGLHRKLAEVGMRAAGIAVIIIALMTIGKSTGIFAYPHSSGSAPPPCCCGGENR